MTSDFSLKHQNFEVFFFLAFVLLLPNMIVLNLPQFNLKIAGIGMGAFFIYSSAFMLFFIKFYEIIRKTLMINGTQLCFLIFLLLLVLKQVQAAQALDRFLVQLSPYILMPLFFVLGQVYIKHELERKQLVKVLLINTLTGALVGIAHFYFFPDFQLYDSTANEGEFFSVIDYETMKTRETSTYSTPVAFSHNITFGIIFMLILVKQLKTNKTLIVFMTIVAFWGVYISYSRAALLFLCMYILFSFIDNAKGVGKKIVSFIIVSIVAVFYSFINVSSRLSISTDNITGEIRWLKWYVALSDIFASWSNLLFGVRFGSEASTIDGVEFSDNYYILHQLNFGLLGIVVLFLLVRYCYKKLRTLRFSQLSVFDMYYIKSISVIGYAALFFACFSNILLMVPTNIYLSILMGSIWNIKKAAAVSVSK